MGLVDRMAKASDRFYDRMRSAEAATLADAAATGKVDDLRRRKYCVVVTYKKNGDAVPSPVWFGTGSGKVYFQTGATSSKVKRIGRNPQVRVAPSTSRGRPIGPPFLGTARVVPPEGEPEAERCLQANYGLGRRLYERVVGTVASVYVEVTPT